MVIMRLTRPQFSELYSKLLDSHRVAIPGLTISHFYNVWSDILFVCSDTTHFVEFPTEAVPSIGAAVCVAKEQVGVYGLTVDWEGKPAPKPK